MWSAGGNPRHTIDTLETLVDKPEYDRPDDDDSSGSKAVIFLVLALAVVGVFYFGYYR